MQNLCYINQHLLLFLHFFRLILKFNCASNFQGIGSKYTILKLFAFSFSGTYLQLQFILLVFHLTANADHFQHNRLNFIHSTIFKALKFSKQSSIYFPSQDFLMTSFLLNAIVRICCPFFIFSVWSEKSFLLQIFLLFCELSPISSQLALLLPLFLVAWMQSGLLSYLSEHIFFLPYLIQLLSLLKNALFWKCLVTCVFPTLISWFQVGLGAQSKLQKWNHRMRSLGERFLLT